MDYRLFIDIQVLEFVEQLQLQERHEIRDALRIIQANPNAQIEAEDMDSTGRPLCIKIVGDLLSSSGSTMPTNMSKLWISTLRIASSASLSA